MPDLFSPITSFHGSTGESIIESLYENGCPDQVGA
jgi:hypothetical protein